MSAMKSSDRLMIDPVERAICKRRGHSYAAIQEGWTQCEWCGIWLRQVRTIEEREDEPPKHEQSPFEMIRRIGPR